MKKLYLIDGTALLYRAYFAFIRNPLLNSRGENTSAIFGVINSFITLIDKMNAEYLAIAFDRKAPTFRHNDYEKYKANRPPMPDDLASQIHPVIHFFDLLRIPQVGADGYEADDALGTMGKHFKGDYQVIYVTSDKDYCQLVDSYSILYDPMKDSFTDSEAVVKKYGVKPEQFVDYLALVGDKSDNIPGVRGIGEVAAKALLNQYPNLDEIYEHLTELPAKYQKKLIENKDDAFLSRHLARIVTDAKLDLPDTKDLYFEARQLREALPLLKEMGIKSLLRRIEARFPTKDTDPELKEQQVDIFKSAPPSLQPEEPKQDHFEAILADTKNFSKILDEILLKNRVSIDTETDSLDARSAALVGISICVDAAKAYYIPVGHQMADNLELDKVIESLAKVCDGKEIIGHNLKFDIQVLARHGWQISEPFFDTMIAAYVLDAGAFGFSLDRCAQKELNYEMMPITELLGKGKKQVSMDLINPEDVCFYAAEDAWAAFMLSNIYREKLEQSPAKSVYYDLDLPLMPVLMKMEDNGVSIDKKILSDISHKLNLQIKRLTEEIYEIAGYDFNLNSTQQLAKLLFEDMSLPAKKKTKSGYSTDNSVLESLAEDYEIARKIIEYRQLVKLENTYVSALPKLVNPVTKRIHSSFNQCVASTGRLSSTNPNLQNIPVRTKLGREIRKAFVAENDDYRILAADYSQIELRLLALMSGDEMMLKSFRDKVDIHKQTAAQIYHVDLQDVTSDMRRVAKTINFGLMYGMGYRKLSREIGISQAEAKEMIEQYFAQFPAIQDFKAHCIATAKAEGRARTLFGRVLALPGIYSKNKATSSEAERVAVNMPIQGSAADLIKRAMLTIHALISSDQNIRMIMQVHDELVFEVHQSKLDQAKDLIKTEMELALPQEYRDRITLEVDIGIGKNWYEAH
nr:polymerase [Candidatus Cloacimonadota bacterium]